MYKEIQSGAVAKSYMRKGSLIYEEMSKYFPIYEEAVSHIWLCNYSILNFLIYEENLIFLFISVPGTEVHHKESTFFLLIIYRPFNISFIYIHNLNQGIGKKSTPGPILLCIVPTMSYTVRISQDEL